MSFLWLDEYDEVVNEFRREERTYSCNMRRRLRDFSNPLEMDEFLFKRNFRLSKHVFIYLLRDIEPKLGGVRTSSIPPIVKFVCLLRFCAQGSYQLSIANDYNVVVGRSTVSEILTELLNIFEKYICPKWVKFNCSEEEENNGKRYFYNKSRIPGIIGCVDGTHIKIRCPARNLQHLYYNRKGFFSINAMIVCNHEMIIKYINGRYPGASHDSMVWDMSRLKILLQEKYNSGIRNSWLLGDAGYPLCPFLITPFRNTDPNSREANFNHHHSKARIIIENTIGLLKNRFRCLLGARELHFQPEKVTKIINVCAALHNICLHHNIQFDTLETSEVDEYEMNENGSNEENVEGQTIRNRLVDSLT